MEGREKGRETRARLVVYANDRIVEFPNVTAPDAATAAAVAEEVARSVGAAGKFDEDEAFFAFLDACADRGVEQSDATTVETRLDAGFVSLVEGRSPFHVDGAVALLNAGTKHLALEREDENGTLEGYVFEPRTAATLVDGRVTNMGPTAKEGYADGCHFIPIPYGCMYGWRDSKTGKNGTFTKTYFARLEIEVAKSKDFVESARVKSAKSGEVVTYYARGGRFYVRRGDMRGMLSRQRDDALRSDSESVKRRFADAAKTTTTSDCLANIFDHVWEIQLGERTTSIALDTIVETEDGSLWRETDSPKYVLVVLPRNWDPEGVRHPEARLMMIDISTKGAKRQTEEDGRHGRYIRFYPMTEREKALAEGVALAEMHGLVLDVDSLPEVEIVDEASASAAPWRGVFRRAKDYLRGAVARATGRPR